MSYVCDTILITPIYFDEEAEVLEEVNKFFEGSKGFVSVSDKSLPRGWYGGPKALQCGMFIGAFNYLDVDKLVNHLHNIDWKETYGHSVQLIIKNENDNEFRIITILEGDKND